MKKIVELLLPIFTFSCILWIMLGILNFGILGGDEWNPLGNMWKLLGISLFLITIILFVLYFCKFKNEKN